MKYLLQMKLESPLLTGGRKEDRSFFLSSRDYISGSVLRAAFAKRITAECPYAAQRERRNWVEFADEAACTACQWQDWCRQFSQIRFSHLFLDGKRVAPQTMMLCKYRENQCRPFDSLLQYFADEGRMNCPACKEDRVERYSGYLPETPIPAKRLIMRLQVDEYRHTAAEGMMFSLRPLTAGQVFCGSIVVPAGKVSLPDTELRVGAKNSVGLGKVQLAIKTASAPERTLEERVKGFNRVISKIIKKKTHEKNTNSEHYISVTFLSDAAIEWSLPPAPGRSTAELRQDLCRLILPEWEGIETVYAAADFLPQGGYATDMPGGQPVAARLYLAAGSVFLLKMPGPLMEQQIKDLHNLEAQGIGKGAADGHGAVAVCDNIHWKEVQY